MGAQTEIAWCDSTFNPWIGCTKISPGCDHCYAERDMDTRRHVAKWGAGNPRKRTTAQYWQQPLHWNVQRFVECGNCGARGVSMSKVEDICDACCSPDAQLANRRVFCASLADVFDHEVDVNWRDDLFALIAATPRLDWLLLTKRIGNVQRMLPTSWGGEGWPNVWIGATIVNQAEADRDIPKLLDVRARVKFVSVEPMLGPISLWRHLRSFPNDANGIDWVIAGGESGPQARPMHPEWPRSLAAQCHEFGTPFLFKQWGEFLPGGIEDAGTWAPDWEHCPSPPLEGRVRVVVEHGIEFGRVGKAVAGRVLDGEERIAFPR